jgi:hypothetical protein
MTFHVSNVVIMKFPYGRLDCDAVESGSRWPTFVRNMLFLDSLTLNIKSIRSLETSLTVYQFGIES